MATTTPFKTRRAGPNMEISLPDCPAEPKGGESSRLQVDSDLSDVCFQLLLPSGHSLSLELIKLAGKFTKRTAQ